MASFSVARGAGAVPLAIVAAGACLILGDRFITRAGPAAPSSLSALERAGSQRPTSTDGRQRRRILYIEGAPRPEMKFVKRAMDDVADPRVVQLQRTTDGKYLRMNVDGPEELRDGFPTSSDQLFAFRGLILGPIEASAFTPDQHQMIADFVGVRGGGLLVLGGEQSLGEGGWAGTPLSDVLPIIIGSGGRAPQSTRARDELFVRPTIEGLNHPAVHIADNEADALSLWQQLPPVAARNAVDPKPGATTLLDATDKSGGSHVVLAIENQGRGKTAVFTVEDSWRWVMLAKIDSPVHERFWRSLLAWLVDGVPQG
jgi:uncharacterized membrane protein